MGSGWSAHCQKGGGRRGWKPGSSSSFEKSLLLTFPFDVFMMSIFPALGITDLVRLEVAVRGHALHFETCRKVADIISAPPSGVPLSIASLTWLWKRKTTLTRVFINRPAELQVNDLRRLSEIGNCATNVSHEGSVNATTLFCEHFIATCTNLQSLTLRCTTTAAFIGQVFPYLYKHGSTLTEIDFSATEFAADALEQLLECCPHLSSLALLSCGNVSDKTLSIIARCCPSLKLLGLSETSQISDEGVTTVTTACTNLQTIAMIACPCLTYRSLDTIAQHCPKLRSLTADYWWRGEVTDTTIMQLSACCPLLEEVSLAGHSKITSSAVVSLVQSHPNLRILSISECDDSVLNAMALNSPCIQHFAVTGRCAISGAGLIRFAEHCNSLEALTVTKAEFITDHALIALVQNSPGLEILHLCGCSLLSDTSLEAIGLYCCDLKDFAITDCENVSDVGLVAIGMGCPNLVEINLRGCEGLMAAGLSVLMGRCSRLQRVTTPDGKPHDLTEF